MLGPWHLPMKCVSIAVRLKIITRANGSLCWAHKPDSPVLATGVTTTHDDTSSHTSGCTCEGVSR